MAQTLHIRNIKSKFLNLSKKLLLSFHRHLTFIFGGSATNKAPKVAKSFIKVENWKVAEIPVCSRSNNSGFFILLFFNEASSKLVQVIAVIVSRKIFIFERACPRHHLHNDQTDSRTWYTVRSLQLCSPVLRHFIFCTHARRLSHDMHLATRDRHRVLCFTGVFGNWICELIHAAGIIIFNT